jgi:polyisoprenoid-binding protein YceI
MFNQHPSHFVEHAMTTTPIPAGTWTIDPSHSEVGFSVRHLMVSKVKGTFGTFEGAVTVADDPLQSSVNATIDLASISTGDAQRDGHLKSDDFFGVESNPTMTFASTSVAAKGDDFAVSGDLTIKGVTKVVELALEFNGVGPDPWGGTRAGFTATTEISRKEFGVDIDMPLEGGGVVVGDKISITLEVEAVLQAA